MEPLAACQRFELRRFPSRQSLIVGIMGSVNLAAALGRGWVLELLFGGVLLAYWIWRFLRPCRALLLTETEVVGNIDLLEAIRVPKRLVEEVSPSSNGVIITWKNAGVPCYTHIRASWFHESVWRQAYPALLSWAKPSSTSPGGSQEISRG